jgi:hypothetical protein
MLYICEIVLNRECGFWIRSSIFRIGWSIFLTLKKVSGTHVIKLGFAPKSYPPGETHAIQLGFALIVYPPGQYK